MSGFPLAHRDTIERCPIGGDVFGPQGYDVAAPQLIVDRRIEDRQISQATIDLELGSD